MPQIGRDIELRAQRAGYGEAVVGRDGTVVHLRDCDAADG
jgi:hypothetical protein